jgi:hypothetical protein
VEEVCVFGVADSLAAPRAGALRRHIVTAAEMCW